MSPMRMREHIREDGDGVYHAVFHLLDDPSSLYELNSEDAADVAAITKNAFERAMQTRMGVSVTKKF